MNVRDSSWLAAALEKRGFVEAPFWEADIYILNTCSVRAKPERKVAERIRRFQAMGNGRLIAVLGCVAQQRGRELFLHSPLVRLVAGTDGIARVPAEIARLLENPDQTSCLVDFLKTYPEREPAREKIWRGSAFVNIMQGCDNFCSYCIVPFTRGRQKSRNVEDILAECKAHVAAGAIEITLLGQNVNAYGKDNGQISFASLLRGVASLPGLQRLRFITPHPADLDSETVELFAELPALCPRLHLPLQSGSDAVLAKMRRRYDSGQYLDLVRKLREARPDLALSTDLIVGFPGETETDFEGTLQMMRECGFMDSYSFCYSDRPGTRASRMQNQKVSPGLMSERLQRLQALQDELSARWLGARIGQKAKVILTGLARAKKNSASTWLGKDEYGVSVNLELPNGREGAMLDVKIVAANPHSLLGEAL